MASMLTRRSALAALAPTVLLTATPAWPIPLGPLTTLSRLADATKSKRFLDAAAKSLEGVQQPGTDAEAQPADGPVVAGSEALPAEEPILNTAAGLAKVEVELNVAYSLAEDVDTAGLYRLLSSSVFVSFLGVVPASQMAPASRTAVAGSVARRVQAETGLESWRQIQLLETFPSKVRIEAATTLRTLNTKLAALAGIVIDGASPSVSSISLTTAVAEAKTEAKKITELFLADGCFVCPEPVHAATQDELSQNMRMLSDFEPRLLRRPDERDEALARKLGFRQGELIGGYETK